MSQVCTSKWRRKERAQFINKKFTVESAQYFFFMTTYQSECNEVTFVFISIIHIFIILKLILGFRMELSFHERM